MTVAQSERALLVETLKAVGPDAPTLCEGWTTRDLTAHLVLREHRLDAAPGIALAPFAGYTAKVQSGIAAQPWDRLVDQVASGPPLFSPFKLLDPVVNPVEMFVHHEDVRRARPGWEPRTLDAATAAALRRQVPRLSRVALTKVPARVSLRTPDGATLATVGSGPQVSVTGDPGELLLWLFGRDETRCRFEGDPDAVAAAQAAKRGL
jgi:uncharacterized protein (TIGR03085 family)